MCAIRTGRVPPKTPAYVLEWVGRRVIAPCDSGPQEGLVTSVKGSRGPDGQVLTAHVVIDGGPMWIGNVKMLHTLANRTTEHGELDDL